MQAQRKEIKSDGKADHKEKEKEKTHKEANPHYVTLKTETWMVMWEREEPRIRRQANDLSLPTHLEKKSSQAIVICKMTRSCTHL